MHLFNNQHNFIVHEFAWSLHVFLYYFRKFSKIIKQTEMKEYVAQIFRLLVLQRELASWEC